jgi:hypothetical protein
MKIRKKERIKIENKKNEGMRKIKKMEEGSENESKDEKESVFEKNIFKKMINGNYEMWEGKNEKLECSVVNVGEKKMRFEWLVNGIEMKMGYRFNVKKEFGFVNLDINYVVNEDDGV